MRLPDMTHSRVGSWIYFKAVSTDPISEEQAKRLQIEAGYPVMGYGFYWFTIHHNNSGEYLAGWKCSSICD